ncbi:hypothetical protein Tco_1447741 [Tanacetum coccineum]
MNLVSYRIKYYWLGCEEIQECYFIVGSESDLVKGVDFTVMTARLLSMIDYAILSVEGFEGMINSVGFQDLATGAGRGKVLRDPFFIIEVDKNAIPEFSTIVSSELFDFDVILIFNSFDERHDGFSLDEQVFMPKPVEIFRSFGKEARFLSRRCHVKNIYISYSWSNHYNFFVGVEDCSSFLIKLNNILSITELTNAN